MSDFRVQDLITFKPQPLTLEALLVFLGFSGSRRPFREDMLTEQFGTNLEQLLGEPVERRALPDAVNYFLAGLPDHELADIAVDMTAHLLRQRSLEEYRFQGCWPLTCSIHEDAAAAAPRR